MVQRNCFSQDIIGDNQHNSMKVLRCCLSSASYNQMESAPIVTLIIKIKKNLDDNK